jgi:hypothetical protein
MLTEHSIGLKFCTVHGLIGLPVDLAFGNTALVLYQSCVVSGLWSAFLV